VTIVETEIREHAVAYLAGEASLDDFERWFIPATWDLEARADVKTLRLAYGINLLLAERAQEHVTEPELQRDLRTLVQRGSLGEPQMMFTRSSAVTQVAPFRIAVVGRRSEVVPA
jgi:hypothetical protein